MTFGKLILVPSGISEEGVSDSLSANAIHETSSCKSFIVERAKTARRFLKEINYPLDFDSIEMVELNKHGPDDPNELLAPCLAGNDVGLISEAGVPAVADPGGFIVRAAHDLGIKVVPLVGPSSILLALMGAGLNGQKFKFHGYLPREERDLVKRLKALEAESLREELTQIFIETPYRNEKIYASLIKNLRFETDLSIAIDLAGADERIQTKYIGEWHNAKFKIPRKPAIFMLLARKNDKKFRT